MAKIDGLSCGISGRAALILERFRAKWMPVRVKKTRQNKKLEPHSDSIGMEKAPPAEA
jgi:hypothetical protein